MEDVKRNALSSIKEMLSDKMAGHLKPKAVAVVEEEPVEIDGMAMEGEESEGLENLPEGADISNPDPEEKMELERLYQKMGC